MAAQLAVSILVPINNLPSFQIWMRWLRATWGQPLQREKKIVFYGKGLECSMDSVAFYINHDQRAISISFPFNLFQNIDKTQPRLQDFDFAFLRCKPFKT